MKNRVLKKLTGVLAVLLVALTLVSATAVPASAHRVVRRYRPYYAPPPVAYVRYRPVPVVPPYYGYYGCSRMGGYYYHPHYGHHSHVGFGVHVVF
jgi:hypothetical protein